MPREEDDPVSGKNTRGRSGTSDAARCASSRVKAMLAYFVQQSPLPLQAKP